MSSPHILTKPAAYCNSYVDTNVVYFNNKEFLVTPVLTCGGVIHNKCTSIKYCVKCLYSLLH